eukprot:152012_1
MAIVDGIVISLESAKSTYEKQIERLIGKIGEIRSDYDRKICTATRDLQLAKSHQTSTLAPLNEKLSKILDEISRNSLETNQAERDLSKSEESECLAQENLKNRRTECEVLIADIESKKLIVSKLENDLEGKNKELDICDDQRHCHEAELLEFRDRIDISNRERANIQQRIKSQQAKLLELSGNSSLTADTGATQSQSLKLLFEESFDLESELSEIDPEKYVQETADMRTKISNLKSRLKEVNQTKCKFEKEMNTLEEECRNIEEQKTDLTVMFAGLTERLKLENSDVSEKTTMLKALENES